MAPGKLSMRIAGAMHKPAAQPHGAKKVPKGSPGERPPRSRSRAASLRSTTSAGYSSASPRQRFPSSPVMKPKADPILRAESKVVDSGVGPKMGAKPVNLKLQKKPSPAAKAEPRDRSSFTSSPVRNLNDIKLSSTGRSDFTTSYSPNNSTHSSPDSFSPGMKFNLQIGAEHPQAKREHKRMSRYQRKKQAKRDGAKQTVYIEEASSLDDWDHSTGLSILRRTDSKGVAAAKSLNRVDSTADDRYARDESRMHHKAEEKRASRGVAYSDYLDYI